MFWFVNVIFSLFVKDSSLIFHCDKYEIANGYCTNCNNLVCLSAECLDDYLWNGVICTIGPPPPPLPPV
jgi:hypothetical protein